MSTTPQTDTPKKTYKDVEVLKRQWFDDPCFDLEDTEGFEEYRVELLAYSNVCKKQWAEKRPRWNIELLGPPGTNADFTDVTDLNLPGYGDHGSGEISFRDNQGTTHRTTWPYLITNVSNRTKVTPSSASAAPDMLDALKAAIAFIGQTQEYKTGHTGAGSIVTQGNAAIAKAEGRV